MRAAGMRAAACGIALAWGTGCASLVAGPPPPELAARAGQRVVIDVPFHPQTRNHCGPASLAMVLGWAGDPARPDELAELSYTPERKGALQTDLLGAVRRRGSLPYLLGSPGALFAELAAEHPVLVLQNLGFGWLPRWHYAVVIGFDEPRDSVVLHTGPRKAREIPRTLLDRTWARSGHWGIVVLPPGTVPATADELPYLEAVSALESTGQASAAARAYAAATDRWPHSANAWLGLGNAKYGQGRLGEAEAAFSQATVVDSHSSAAYNNLAHVLLESGQREEALLAATRAVALGGPLRPTSLETLRQVEAALAR